jgi:hypothetical protein
MWYLWAVLWEQTVSGTIIFVFREVLAQSISICEQIDLTKTRVNLRGLNECARGRSLQRHAMLMDVRHEKCNRRGGF